MPKATNHGKAEDAARDLLIDLVGPDFSDTTLRVTTDHLLSFARSANVLQGGEHDRIPVNCTKTKPWKTGIFLKWCLIGLAVFAVIQAVVLGMAIVPIHYWRIVTIPAFGGLGALLLDGSALRLTTSRPVAASWGAATFAWVTPFLLDNGTALIAHIAWTMAIILSVVAILTLALHKATKERPVHGL